MRPQLLALLVLPLAACSSAPRESALTVLDASPVSMVPVNGGTPTAAISEALVRLPDELGSVRTIRERQYPNGTRQDIVLSSEKATAGENVIEVSLQTEAARPGSRADMQIGKPSESGIRNEILSRFRDVRMNIVTQPRQNALGTFGFAIGKQANGGRCLFAWQWVEDVTSASAGQTSFSRLGSLLSSGGSRPMSIRIRICRGDLTADQLAADIEALQTGEPTALQRLVTMDRRALAAGPVLARADGGTATDAGIAPVAGTLESALGDSRPVASTSRRAASPHRVARRTPRPAKEDVSNASSTVSSQAPAWTPPPSYSGGPRYMAPVDGHTVAPPVATVPSYPGGSSSPLSTNLPPQAYQGPRAQQNQNNGYGSTYR